MNSNYEKEYKNLIKDILINGVYQKTRNGNTKSLFGLTLSFNNKSGIFPMLTSKEMFFKNIKYELKWFIDGLTNVNYLKNNGVSIWNMWADETGEIGDTYGRQLRSFNGIDQFRKIMQELQDNKNSRQMVISLWNPVSISQGNIKPCYHAFQFVCINDTLNIIVSQRSADVFIGLPYDMAVFSLMLVLICNEFNLRPGVVKINIGNAHIYEEHTKPCMEYLNRIEHDLPSIQYKYETIQNFSPAKIELKNYNSEPFIKAKIIK